MSSTIDFPTFVLSVASAAMMGLGLAPRPDSGKTEVDLETGNFKVSEGFG